MKVKKLWLDLINFIQCLVINLKNLFKSMFKGNLELFPIQNQPIHHPVMALEPGQLGYFQSYLNSFNVYKFLIL
jgi:hypothetical protein